MENSDYLFVSFVLFDQSKNLFRKYDKRIVCIVVNIVVHFVCKHRASHDFNAEFVWYAKGSLSRSLNLLMKVVVLRRVWVSKLTNIHSQFRKLCLLLISIWICATCKWVPQFSCSSPSLSCSFSTFAFLCRLAFNLQIQMPKTNRSLTLFKPERKLLIAAWVILKCF